MHASGCGGRTEGIWLWRALLLYATLVSSYLKNYLAVICRGVISTIFTIISSRYIWPTEGNLTGSINLRQRKRESNDNEVTQLIISFSFIENIMKVWFICFMAYHWFICLITILSNLFSTFQCNRSFFLLLFFFFLIIYNNYFVFTQWKGIQYFWYM